MDSIETTRTVLRRFLPGDVDSLTHVLGNAEVMRFSLSGPYSREQCEAFIVWCQGRYTSRGYGLFGVIEKETNNLIGYCGFYDQVIEGREEVEIGFRLHPRSWNRGIGTGVARTVRDYGFGKLGLPRLISIIDPENIASIRVAEKIGMTLEKQVMLPGYDHPDLIYAVVKGVGRK